MTATFNDASMTVPRVSVGMPVYNGEDHVREAIESIVAQTYTDFELIIADNCSEDNTERICREYAEKDPRIRFFRHEQNLGASKNFSFVFNMSRGSYFKWAAHDDMLAPEYVQRCVEMLDECGPNVVLCFPQRLVMTHDGRVLGPDPPARWFEVGPPFDQISFARLMQVNAFHFCIFGFGLMRREVLAKTHLIGPYSYSDLVLAAEMRLIGEFREIAEPLYYMRLHDEGTPAMKKRRTWIGEAEYLDPSSRGKKTRPEPKLLYERLRAVHQYCRPWYKKLWCYAWVLYGSLVVRSMHVLYWHSRKIAANIWAWWERTSAVWIGRCETNCLAHRGWALLSGLRNWNMDNVTLAIARGTPNTEKALVEFVARKLSNRDDHYSKEVLNNWLHGCCPVRKSAAAGALGVPIVAEPCSDRPVSTDYAFSRGTSHESTELDFLQSRRKSYL
jgi:glycosyltransferase involved in cell wall biosynthesis